MSQVKVGKETGKGADEQGQSGQVLIRYRWHNMVRCGRPGTLPYRGGRVYDGKEGVYGQIELVDKVMR